MKDAAACCMSLILLHAVFAVLNRRHSLLPATGFCWSQTHSHAAYVRCSHCRDLEATWDALADELKGKVNVAKVPYTPSS